MKGKARVKYKSVIETVEFKCPERQYRVIEVKRFDSKGRVVDADQIEPVVAWKEIASGTMMDKLLEPACKIIYEKKRNP